MKRWTRSSARPPRSPSRPWRLRDSSRRACSPHTSSSAGRRRRIGVAPIAVCDLSGLFLLGKRLRSKLRLTGDAPVPPRLRARRAARRRARRRAPAVRRHALRVASRRRRTCSSRSLLRSGVPSAGLAVVAWVVASRCAIRYKTLGEASLEALATQAGFAYRVRPPQSCSSFAPRSRGFG